ncbi:MAG: hypothetical protein HZC17_09520 [Candidatus Omnitrophica bacterium]|nr:hypothetical protein [Candidatus Omnitrophota bacterium]
MKKLLLADADSLNSEVLQIALMGEGYRVTRVQSIESWNELSSKKPFHLIIMDESFLSLSKHLFELSKDAFRFFEKTPMIVMTEYPELVECRYRFPQKARFLLKPFQAGEMFSLVRQVFFEDALAVA